jgi:triacylglycerol lipase
VRGAPTPRAGAAASQLRRRVLACSLWLVGSLGAAAPAPVAAQAAAPEAAASRPLVVLVHGLGRTSASMLPLKWALEEEGYEVLNFGYPSTRAGVAELADRLAARVRAEHRSQPRRPVHWVGHSMGGVLIRWALAENPDLAGGRVVVLASPANGAAAADRYEPLVGWILRPLEDLRTAEGSVARRTPPPRNVQVGVIAAAWDGKVTVPETHIAGEVDHVVLRGWHTFIMAQPSVQRQVAAFLRDGCFTAGASRAADAVPGAAAPCAQRLPVPERDLR